MRRDQLDRTKGFLLTCFLVSLLLLKHEWFMKPVQPAHFSRGYHWLPLCLLALPALQRVLQRVHSRLGPVALSLGVLLFGLVAVSDNAVFMAKQWQALDTAQHLGPAERGMFRWMEAEGLDGVLLSSDERLSYLSATYTSVRPYLGHVLYTQHFLFRSRQIKDWFEGRREVEWLDPIDYILVPGVHQDFLHKQPHWELWHQSDDLLLFRRRGLSP
jgi:hypothetical protein